MLCRNTEALRKYEAELEEKEKMLEQIEQLIECRADDAVNELEELIKEIAGMGLDSAEARDLVLEHLGAVL